MTGVQSHESVIIMTFRACLDHANTLGEIISTNINFREIITGISSHHCVFSKLLMNLHEDRGHIIAQKY